MKNKPQDRDYGKYRFNGKLYNKAQLVLAVILFYVNENPKTTAAQLKSVFSRDLQNRFPVVVPVKEAIKINKTTRIKRFFDRKEQLVKTFSGLKFAVTNYWGSSNIQVFIDFVKAELGYRITRVA